jgi:hypothetical protein
MVTSGVRFPEVDSRVETLESATMVKIAGFKALSRLHRGQLFPDCSPL